MSDPDIHVLHCPSCGTSLAARDLDEGRGVSTCGHCGALMSQPVAHRDFQARTEAPLPKAIRMRTTVDGVEIRRRWLTWGKSLMVFVCVYLVIATLDGWSTVVNPRGDWIARVLPLLPAAIGMIAVYWTLAIFFNTTRVTLDRQRLTITHGPVPWPGNRMIPRDCIEQFYCVEKRNRGKGPATATYRYEVWMQARDGGHSRVIAGGPGGLNSDEALALEQQLEQALGIPDRPVSGEFPPNWVP